MSSQLWGAVVAIVLGYVLGFYFQSRSIAHLDKRIDGLRMELDKRIDGLRMELDKRIDDLRTELNHRFDDLKDWIRSEVQRLEGRIEQVEHPVVKG
jgi:Tfp pilus assembly protein PilN